MPEVSVVVARLKSVKKPAPTPPPTDAAEYVSLGVRVAASWGWRLIIIGVAVAALLWMIVQVRIVVIPLLIAILLTALLRPIVNKTMTVGLPKWLGVLAALFTLIFAVSALSYLVFTRFQSGFGGLQYATIKATNQLIEWLEEGAFFGMSFSSDNLRQLFDQAMQFFSVDNMVLWSGALEIGTTVGQFLMGLLLCLFTTIFLLIDGERIWMWTLGFLPARAHAATHAAGKAGWESIGQYVRVQIFVAFVDALGIGVGAAILGLPLVIPLAILVFLASFIPFLGAILTGLLATFVALVYSGPVTALIMLAIVILVNQIEGHILQPLVMGNAVRVHPLGVVVAVTTGALIAGIPGALFAVPIVASLNAMVHTFVHGSWRGTPDPVAAFHEQHRQHEETKRLEKIRQRIARKARRPVPATPEMKDDA